MSDENIGQSINFPGAKYLKKPNDKKDKKKNKEGLIKYYKRIIKELTD